MRFRSKCKTGKHKELIISHPGSYIYLSSAQWRARIENADAAAAKCRLCPRLCKVDRLKGERGYCGAPDRMIISSIFPHHGEEPPISGSMGSGTVFFSYCSLKCCFCQNHQISHEYEGRHYSEEELAVKLINLQELGCHNINLVTPTHFLPWILRSIQIAAGGGLELPIVYNCGGYELAETLSILDGIVDIYLPDMKYGRNGPAREYSNASDYVEINREAVREMFRQTGPLRTGENGTAYRGLCIRHLVLPENRSCGRDVLDFLKSNFDPSDISISLMAQYRPLYKAPDFPLINRTLTVEEYEGIRTEFIDSGFDGFYQEISRIDRNFLIDFKKRKEERLTGE